MLIFFRRPQPSAILGFYVWHRQLARKRYFEIADAALSAFNRAEAALTYAPGEGGDHDPQWSSR